MRIRLKAIVITILAASMVMVASLTGCMQGAPSSSSENGAHGQLQTLKAVVEVDGRQGVATENGRYWVSGSTTLSRYDENWNLVATNDAPFEEGYKREVNHIGDIDVYNNEVYCGVELFKDGVASNIQIAVYDGDTLELKRTFNFEESSGQDECSGICVNADGYDREIHEVYVYAR